MHLDLDTRAALRSLARSPGYLVTTLLSLGLGIGAAAAAFGVIDAVRLRARHSATGFATRSIGDMFCGTSRTDPLVALRAE